MPISGSYHPIDFNTPPYQHSNMSNTLNFYAKVSPVCISFVFMVYLGSLYFYSYSLLLIFVFKF